MRWACSLDWNGEAFSTLGFTRFRRLHGKEHCGPSCAAHETVPLPASEVSIDMPRGKPDTGSAIASAASALRGEPRPSSERSIGHSGSTTRPFPIPPCCVRSQSSPGFQESGVGGTRNRRAWRPRGSKRGKKKAPEPSRGSCGTMESESMAGRLWGTQPIRPLGPLTERRAHRRMVNAQMASEGSVDGWIRKCHSPLLASGENRNQVSASTCSLDFDLP